MPSFSDRIQQEIPRPAAAVFEETIASLAAAHYELRFTNPKTGLITAKKGDGLLARSLEVTVSVVGLDAANTLVDIEVRTPPVGPDKLHKEMIEQILGGLGVQR